MSLDYHSLNVSGLKALLSERHLPQTGKKQDLINRLIAHEAKASENTVAGDTEGLKDAALATSVDQVASASTVTPISYESIPPTDGAATYSNSVDTTKMTDKERLELRKQKFGTYDEKEKKLARAKRFNLSTPELEEEKRRQREIRFGTVGAQVTAGVEKKGSTSTAKLILADLGKEVDEEEQQKRMKRAARFGIVDEEAKKRIRMERFGIVDEAEQIRRRIERFGPVAASHS